MLSKIRILALDDDPTMGALFSVAFRNLPVELISVENETHAGELLKQRSFDLFLVDLQLGERDGLKVAEESLTRLQLAIPIVLVTAQAGDQLQEEFVNSGRCLGVVSKPIRLKDFGADILRYWDRTTILTGKGSSPETDLPSLRESINTFLQKALSQAKDFRLRSDFDLQQDELLAKVAHKWAGVSGIDTMPRVEVEARKIEKLALSKDESRLADIRQLLSLIIEKLECASSIELVSPNQ